MYYFLYEVTNEYISDIRVWIKSQVLYTYDYDDIYTVISWYIGDYNGNLWYVTGVISPYITLQCAFEMRKFVYRQYNYYNPPLCLLWDQVLIII